MDHDSQRDLIFEPRTYPIDKKVYSDFLPEADVKSDTEYIYHEKNFKILTTIYRLFTRSKN